MIRLRVLRQRATRDLGITVTVSGPGGVIGYEVELVRRALEAGGLVVIDKDDCPLEDIPNDAAGWWYHAARNLPWGG